MQHIVEFNDQNIQQLFGFEDAESENPERLKEYFLKKDTFDRVTTDLPLRILVGHKGTGKSAASIVYNAVQVARYRQMIVDSCL